MGTVDLRFVSPVGATPGEVALRFGATGVAPVVIDGALSLVLPAPDLSALALSAIGTYDTELITDVGPTIAAMQGGPAEGATGLSVHHAAALRATSPARAAHTAADPLQVGAAARQRQMLPAGRHSHTQWQHAAQLGNGARTRHGDMLRHRRTIAAPAQHGIPIRQGARSRNQERIRVQHRLRADQQQSVQVVTHSTVGQQQGRPIAKGAAVRAQQMLPLPLGWWQIAYPWPTGPADPNPPSSPVALRFCRLANGTHALIFGCPPAPPPGGLIVPIRKTYIVLNTITLVRASNGAPLSALSLSLQIDTDSWTWGWDASIPGAELALVEPAPGGDPVELLATVNGQQFRLLAERIARDRRFAQSRIRISGRGRAAMLAEPHSPIVTRGNAEARTMQQLLADALTINNVGIGWAVDWQAADWLVPAGLYNHTGSYIAHAQRLAEAAGAYVQADPQLDTLRILPRYPLLPWEWSAATPDITLPSAPVVREAIEWQDKAAYNRVFVSGTESGGVLGQLTRTGTAGDVVAPMITDPLITHADAARARGRPILADTGRQARITLELPILPETGIITPGKLVQYTDAGTTRRGLVRSTAVTAQLPTARQTIELETHA